MPLAVRTVYRARARSTRCFYKPVERHPTELCRRDDQAFESFDIVPVCIDRPHTNFVLFGTFVKGCGFLPGNKRVKRLRNVTHANAEIGGYVAVHFKPHFRLAAYQRRVDVDRVGTGFHLLEDL